MPKIRIIQCRNKYHWYFRFTGLEYEAKELTDEKHEKGYVPEKQSTDKGFVYKQDARVLNH